MMEEMFDYRSLLLVYLKNVKYGTIKISFHHVMDVSSIAQSVMMAEKLQNSKGQTSNEFIQRNDPKVFTTE